MSALLAFALGFAPGLFWLWFFRRRDGYRPTPRRVLLITFALGIAATIPAGVLEIVIFGLSELDIDTVEPLSAAAAMLLVVGPVEETCKFLAVRLYAFRSAYFDEPSDGLILAAAASLGFASLENVGYIAAFGPAVMLLRAPLSTLGHVVFASFWGEALGRRAQAGAASRFGLPLGLAAAAIVHGLFNVAVTAAWWAGLLIIAAGLWWVLRRLRQARRASPFRLRRNYPQIGCPRCGRRVSVAARFCGGCGLVLASLNAPLWCGNCGRRNRAEAGFCSGCGDRLERG